MTTDTDTPDPAEFLAVLRPGTRLSIRFGACQAAAGRGRLGGFRTTTTFWTKSLTAEPRNLHLRLFVYEDPDNNVRFETANMIADMLEKLKMTGQNRDAMTFEQVQEKAAGEFVRPGAGVVPDGCGAGLGIFADEGQRRPTYGRYCVQREMTDLFYTPCAKERDASRNFAHNMAG